MQRELWKNNSTHIGGDNGNMMTVKTSLNICYWWQSDTFDLMGTSKSEAEIRRQLEEHTLKAVLNRVQVGASAGRLEKEIENHSFYGWWTVE